jgi:hypothetical protein
VELPDKQFEGPRICSLHSLQDIVFMRARRTARLPKTHQLDNPSETGEGHKRNAIDCGSIFGPNIKIF